MKNTIIIPFHFTWDWPADYLKQTALELSKQNTVFCYLGIEQFRLKDIFRSAGAIICRVSPSLWLVRPIQIIPFERFYFVRKMNMFLNILILQMIIISITRQNYLRLKKIVWICNHMYYFFPDYILGRKISLYDCVDVVSDTGNQDQCIAEFQENLLIGNVDYMTVISYVLFESHKPKRNTIHIVPQGFRLDSFKKHKECRKPTFPHKPLIGMVGTLDNRIDYQLLFTLMKGNPTWRLELWGTISITDMNKAQIFESVSRLKNVTINSVPTDSIPQIIKTFDIAIIPYDISYTYNQNCYPMKLFEYFYVGKPVVSTPINELGRFFPYVKIGKNVHEWEKLISLLISQSWSKIYQRKQRRLAEENSWENKISAILSILMNRIN